MLTCNCLGEAKLFALLIYFICSLTTGHGETVECDLDPSSIASPKDTLLLVTVNRPCRNTIGKSLTICLLETDTNRSSIVYKITNRAPNVVSSAPFDKVPGFLTEISVCDDYNSLCCSTEYNNNNESVLRVFTQLTFVFSNSFGRDYVMDNIEVLRIIVLNEPLTSEETLAHTRPNLLAVYVLVPLSVVFVVALFVPCLCFLMQSKRKKYIQCREKCSLPVVFAGNSNTGNIATLDNHYSYIEDRGFTNHIFALNYGYGNYENERMFDVPECTEDALYAQFSDIFIKTLLREHVNILNELGSGQFGMVYKGVWSSPRGDMDVAIKTLKEGSKEEDRVKFLQEAAIMGQFQHSSIVTMHGIVTEGQPILLVLELLPKGDLRSHLISSKSKSDSDVINDHTLLSYCRQVAAGMNYLANKHFVHRDLSARNILVSDDEICKIADFGMSRELLYQETYESKGGAVPLRWTAPEALFYKMYSTASDVWSYGILLYEIWSVGHKPYEELQNMSVLIHLKSGKRLAPPPGCPRAIYSIMIDCWNCEPQNRPTFEALSRILSASDLKLLKWSNEDKQVHPAAATLGADLSCAEELYADLRKSYLNSKQTNIS